MGRIYAKAQREKMNRELNEILAMLDSLKDENFQISKQKILARLKEMMTENESHESEIMEPGSSWNFSKSLFKNF